jgi:hypothetical protein
LQQRNNKEPLEIAFICGQTPIQNAFCQGPAQQPWDTAYLAFISRHLFVLTFKNKRCDCQKEEKPYTRQTNPLLAAGYQVSEIHPSINQLHPSTQSINPSNKSISWVDETIVSNPTTCKGSMFC